MAKSFYDYDKNHPAAQSIRRILAGHIDKPEPTISQERIDKGKKLGFEPSPSIIPDVSTHALMALQIAIENKLSQKLIEDFFRVSCAALMSLSGKEAAEYLAQLPAADILEHVSTLEDVAEEDTKKFYEFLCTMERLDTEAAYKK